MPYIKQEDRPAMDKVVDAMVEAGVQANGDLNYILYKFCKYNISLNYNSIKNFCGELNAVVAEIRREILTSYEDLKKEENGPV